MRRALVVAAVGFAGVGVVALAVLAFRGREVANPDTPTQGRFRGSEPPGEIRLPHFSLQSYRGEIVRSGDLRGRVVLTTFVDTACTETCPVIVSLLGRALPKLTATERNSLVALALTVNPKSDTPRRVRQFLRRRGAEGKLDYLVAPVPQMKPVWQQFHVLSAVESGDAEIHSAGVRLFDRNGRWVSNLNAGADLTVANLLHDIRAAERGS